MDNWKNILIREKWTMDWEKHSIMLIALSVCFVSNKLCCVHLQCILNCNKPVFLPFFLLELDFTFSDWKITFSNENFVWKISKSRPCHIFQPIWKRIGFGTSRIQYLSGEKKFIQIGWKTTPQMVPQNTPIFGTTYLYIEDIFALGCRLKGQKSKNVFLSCKFYCNFEKRMMPIDWEGNFVQKMTQ